MKPSILVLMPYAMAPARNGGCEKAVATYANLNSVADVTLVWPENSEGFGLARLPGGCLQFSIGLEPEVQLEIETDRANWGSLGWSAALSKHISKSRRFLKGVELLSLKSEIIILSHQWLVDVIPEDYQGTIIFDSFGSEVELLSSQLLEYDQRFQPFNQLIFDELILLTAEIEKRAIERANKVFAMTEAERFQITSAYPGKRVEINATGSDLAELDIPKLEERGSNFLFFGSAHPPNVAAASQIKEIAKRNRDLSFTIAGSVSSHVGKVPENIELIPEISDEDLTKLINSSFAFINPMKSGSGISLKSIRVLMSGLPMISTSLGIRGIPIKNGEEVILSSLENFDSELRNIIGDKDLWRTVSERSSEFAKQMLGWNAISRRFVTLVLGSSTNLSNFNYLPIKKFTQYNCLDWIDYRNPLGKHLQESEDFLSSSIWYRFIKPHLRKITPSFIKKFLKKLI
jgi:glycosyltransferase involved in cell wall biosynthesis